MIRIGAGYQPVRVFDALAAVARKTLSNFTKHTAATPVDDNMMHVPGHVCRKTLPEATEQDDSSSQRTRTPL